MKVRTVLFAVVAGIVLVLTWAAAVGGPVDAGPEPGTGDITIGGRSVTVDGEPRDGQVIGYGVKTGDGCKVDLRLTAQPTNLVAGVNEGTMGAVVGPDCEIVYVADPQLKEIPASEGVSVRADEGTVEGD